MTLLNETAASLLAPQLERTSTTRRWHDFTPVAIDTATLTAIMALGIGVLRLTGHLGMRVSWLGKGA